MNVAEFIDKWRKVELTERSAAQQHFLDLCDLLDHPKPAEVDPKGEFFTFERGAAGHRRDDSPAPDRSSELCELRPPSSNSARFKPRQLTFENAFVESFNGKFRDECLNLHWFTSLNDARYQIERWRGEYNHVRPHSSLDDLTPVEFSQVAGLRPPPASSAPPPPTRDTSTTC